MAISLALGRFTGRTAGTGTIIGRPWSANDVAMVLGWVAILPHAAARFEHDILVPPVSHLSAGGNFLVASAAALAELVVAALLARVLGTGMRKAVRHAVCLWQARRTCSRDRYPAVMLFQRATRVSSEPAMKPYSW